MKKMKMNTTLSEFSAILNRVDTSRDVDQSRTLTGWHGRAAMVRSALEVLRDMRDGKLAEARENYKGARLASIENEINAEYETARELAVAKVESDLQEVLKSKRKAWDKANQPPTDEMLRLLQAIEIRGTDLSAAEVISTIKTLNGNAVSLRALRSICARAGLTLPGFVGADPGEFERQMSEAEEYARSHIDELDKRLEDMTYRERLFWTRPGGGLDTEFFRALDSSTLTSADIRTAATTTDGGKNTRATKTTRASTKASTGGKWSQVTVTEHGFDLRTACEQFGVELSDVTAANPGKRLDSLHQGDTVNFPSTHLRQWQNIKNAVQLENVTLIDAPEPEQMPEGFGEVVELTQE